MTTLFHIFTDLHEAISDPVPCCTAKDTGATLDHYTRRDRCMFDVYDFRSNLNKLLCPPQVELNVTVPLDFSPHMPSSPVIELGVSWWEC